MLEHTCHECERAYLNCMDEVAFWRGKALDGWAAPEERRRRIACAVNALRAAAYHRKTSPVCIGVHGLPRD